MYVVKKSARFTLSPFCGRGCLGIFLPLPSQVFSSLCGSGYEQEILLGVREEGGGEEEEEEEEEGGKIESKAKKHLPPH